MPAAILATLNKKTKITLIDYPYKRDIDNRIFLSELTSLEVTVLQEILNCSIKIPLSELSSSLDIEEKELYPILDKLSQTGLLVRQKDSVFVDKEMRKYYEFYMQKFDEDFEPDMEFLLGILSKVPISVLPTWYNISKTSDNIIASLIEKYLQTPKIYEKHLSDLTFPDPLFCAIIRDIFTSKELMVPADELRKNHNLSKEKFEELMLQLEFHLALCLSYRKHNGKWQAIVTPFHEWREFLIFQQETKPQPISDAKNIAQKYQEEFSLLTEIATFLATAGVTTNKKKNDTDLSPLAIKYCEMMDFIEFTNGKPKPKSSPEHYLGMSVQDQSMYLYRHAFSEIIRENDLEIENPERSFREVEKSLRRVLHCGWIYFEDFMKGFISQVGKAEAVTLKKTGRKWRYALPQYSSEERKFIETVIFGPLSDAGLVLTGTHNSKPCFTVTSFGKIAFGE